MTTCRWILLKMRNISDRICRGIQNALLMFDILFFRNSYPSWGNMEKCSTAGEATDNITIRCMRFSCWITKTIHPHSKYLTLISFPRHQRLSERSSILRFRCSTFFVDCTETIVIVLLHGDDGDYVDDIITVIDITWLRWTRALFFYVIIHIILKFTLNISDCYRISDRCVRIKIIH